MSTNGNLNLKYAGSVKNVFEQKDDHKTLWFSFTDKYSVFDWGEMPDHIANKGNALAFIGSYIFQKLEDSEFWQQLPQSIHLKKFDSLYLEKRFLHPVFCGPDGLIRTGLPSHFLGLYEKSHTPNNTQESENLFKLSLEETTNKQDKSFTKAKLNNQLFMRVLAAEVGWPYLKTILNENVYFYPEIKNSSPRLIPLEVVFSFGLLEGSSLKQKIDEKPAYANCLGLPSLPKVDHWFPQPTLQFFSKLEAKDRLLNWQEAALLANLSARQFEEMVELALDTALALHVLFAERRLELWDGKFEFIFVPQSNLVSSQNSTTGKLLLADSIGPDEIRLLYKGTHLSKEMLRRHYRPTPWYKSLSTARNIAVKKGEEDWQKICREELKQSPAPLPIDLKVVADQLYGMLANEIIGKTIFPAQPDLEEFTTCLDKAIKNQKEHVSA